MGVKEIDVQHRKLFEFANRLHRALNDGHSKREMDVLINGLASFVDYHFTEEEDHLRQIGFTDLAGYHKSQQDLVDHIKTLRTQYDRARTSSPLVFLDFLRNWLDDHIKSVTPVAVSPTVAR